MGPTRSARTLKHEKAVRRSFTLGTLIYSLVQSLLTTNGGAIVALHDGTAGVPPVGGADPEHPTIATIAPKIAVAVRAGLTQTAHA
jgi:hypothetical protein